MGSHRIELFAPSGIPLIEPGADLAAIIIAALRGNGEHLLPGDIVIIAQKIAREGGNRFVGLSASAVAEALE